MYPVLEPIFDATIAGFFEAIRARMGMDRFTLSQAAYTAQLEANFRRPEQLLELADDLHEFILNHPDLKPWMDEVESLYGWLALARDGAGSKVAVSQGRLRLAKIIEAVVLYLDADSDIILRKFSRYVNWDKRLP